MSFYGRYGQYNNYQPDNRRNSFSDDNSGAKRKKPQYKRNKRGSSGSRNINVDTPLFKEPMAPHGRSPLMAHRSPVQNNRNSLRDNPFRYQASSSANAHFDMRDMPNFVEPEHSGPQWQWDNYFQNCKSWQGKHQLAYYRSRCLALEFENQLLFQQINSLMEENCIFAAERGEKPSVRLPDISGRRDWTDEKGTGASNDETGLRKKRPQEGISENSPENSTEFKCVIDEEMMYCMEMSMRHKLTLQRGKNEEAKKMRAEKDKKKKDIKKEEEALKQPVGLQRKEELKELYGENSAMIQKLETAVQLNFNRNCDTFKPELWMVLPLNPNTVI